MCNIINNNINIIINESMCNNLILLMIIMKY